MLFRKFLKHECRWRTIMVQPGCYPNHNNLKDDSSSKDNVPHVLRAAAVAAAASESLKIPGIEYINLMA
ncbi:hypothetical protein [Maridesulfovibrio sp.]|uniref:hypothetical protein n=1 Tax=Maridesulfovibrio sp. TaxID=2795000 RepID=UPI002AA6511A|nr:hypothetical protein [Maridesulfovibrio sp.]